MVFLLLETIVHVKRQLFTHVHCSRVNTLPAITLAVLVNAPVAL